LLITLVGVLCMIGVVMVFSASSITSLKLFGSPWHYLVREWIWLALGWAGLLLASKVHHSVWRRVTPLFMWGSVALLFAVLVPGIGVSAGGATRWIGTSTVQIQPSELAKLALVFFAADVLDRRAGRGPWLYQASPVLAVLVIVAGLVMVQPDMGTTMVVAVVAASMLFAAGIPGRWMAGMGASAVVGAFGLAKVSPYRWRRITAFLHPFAHAYNSGYQSVEGLVALSNGHLVGDGIGTSLASYGYLPNAQTDFIFAVIGEETGLIGGLFVSGLFATLVLVGVRIAAKAPTRYAYLLATGITAWIASQAVINIGAVVGIFPVTGVPLPFVSFGGSSLVISLFGVGVLANIAKSSQAQRIAQP
jgi:cell division protein FtsW